MTSKSCAAAASPGCGANCEGGRLVERGVKVKLSTSTGRRAKGRRMTDPEPEACTSMPEVRAGVDAVDARLVALLARRFAYMRAAARIKPGRDQVRDETRKAAVIAAVRAQAVEASVPEAFVAETWERLVEASIAYELVEWDRLRAD